MLNVVVGVEGEKNGSRRRVIYDSLVDEERASEIVRSSGTRNSNTGKKTATRGEAILFPIEFDPGHFGCNRQCPRVIIVMIM
jgi:hypothetical protein